MSPALRSSFRVLLAFAATIGLILAAAPALHADDGSASTPAAYNGRTINLAESWEGAQACAVFEDRTVCYDTYEQMERATVGEVRRPGDNTKAVADSGSSLLLASSACAGDPYGWLYMYEHTDFIGDVIKFQNTSTWHNLTNYGFNDQTSSVWNNTDCMAVMAEHTNGDGNMLTLFGRTSMSAMPSGWDDRVSSVCLMGLC